MTEQTPSIVLINGASSAGKSTLAKAFQAQADRPFLRFQLDLFIYGGAVLPTRRDDTGAFSWTAMRPMLFDGYYGCLAALAGAGNNLVIDHIIETQNQRARLAQAFAPFDIFYVGLRCTLCELERRERQRGDRRIGDAHRDFARIDQFGPYDVELDATLPAEANAKSLVAVWKARRQPGLFQQSMDHAVSES